MKQIIFSLITILVISCSGERGDASYVRLKGELNNEGVVKMIIQGKGYSKELMVNSNGSFSDTLVVKPGIYAISNGNDRITLFLRNGYDLEMSFKGARLEEGAVYKGIGETTNNFIEQKRMFYISDYANPRTYFELDAEDYEKRISQVMDQLREMKEQAVELDSIVDLMDVNNDERFFGYIKENYEAMNSSLNRLAKGKASPIFENYENIDGAKTSLTDFRGKYVYLDIWATWCAPCKAEIPHLKKIEDTYKDSNIEFISISVDVDEAHETWKNMVKNENLGGVQLYADNNFESEFIMAYGINAIPRFILIDPEGNIVNSDAPRPSNPELKEILNQLLVSD